jgi:protease-4
VYALADGFCASGAYMIACGAKKIYSSAYSTVGSVGVVVQWFNVSEVLAKVGVKPLSVSAGEKKTVLNPFQPPQAEDEECLKPILEESYVRFLDVVSSARPLLSEKVLRNHVGARFYSAQQAKSLGYVDEIVTDRSEVIAGLAQEASLGTDYALIELRSTSGWNDLFETQAQLKTVLEHVQKALALNL